MKRWVALLFVVCSIGILAQEGPPRLRTRVGRKPQAAPVAPTVSITSPTALPTFSTNGTSVILSGAVESTSNTPLASVTWTCGTCTPTSGTAVLGTGVWNTVAAGQPAAVFDDEFPGSGTNVPLTLHTPNPIGSGWVEAVDTTSDAAYIERRSGGYIQPSTSLTSGVPILIATATPSNAISGTNYDVSLSLVDVMGADDLAGIVFGYVDADNYCAAVWYGQSASPDLYLIKRVGGTVSTLSSANIDPTIDDVLEVQVRASSLTVRQNGVARATTTDTFCDDATGVGVGFGSLRDVAGDDLVTSARFDNFTVVDQDAAGDGIALAVGANTISVTVTDAASNTGTDQIVVTRTASDATAPSVTITSPTTSATYATSTTAITLSGTASDNVGVSSVAWACPTCTPTSGSCTGTTSWSCTGIDLAAGSNTITVTAEDAASNKGTDTLDVTYTPSDAIAPTLTITTPTTGTTHTATISPLSVGGTASDNVGVTSVSCANSVGGTVAATGTTSWTASVPLVSGVSNVITCTARDQANNAGTDQLTVSYTADLAIVTATTLPGAEDNSAYAVSLIANGGVSPYTWTETTSTLGTGACAGLGLSSAGVVSGTPTTPGTCNFTAQVSDSAGSPDTASRAFSIVVAEEGAEGPNDFFDNLTVRGDCYLALSMRPQPGNPTQPTACENPYYTNQLLKPTQGGYLNSNNPFGYTTYDFTNDTHPQKQDAMKVRIPAWSAVVPTVAVEVSPSDTQITFTANMTHENDRSYKITVGAQFEVVTVQGAQSPTPTITVARGQFGTTPLTIPVGSTAEISINSIPTHDQVRFPLNTDSTESAGYLIIWEGYWTDSHVNTGLGNMKAFNLSSGGDTFWLEPNTRYNNPSCCPAPGYDPTVHVSTISARSYGEVVAPSTAREPLQPLANPFILEANKWTRFYLFIEQNEDTTAFVDVTTLAADVGVSDTTITINHTGLVDNPFTHSRYSAGGTAPNNYPGRTVKIGLEIMTVVSGPNSGSPRTITVVRGTNGTTASAHSTGATVQLSVDYITMYVADEDTEPTLLYNRLASALYIDRPTVTQRGWINKFWVEFNTSTAKAQEGRAAREWEDLVIYVKNFAVLKNPPADWSALRTKPVR